MIISLQSYLVIGAILFSLGLVGVLTRRNAISVLMSLELIFNAASLNFVAFARYSDVDLSGQVIAIFIIILGAAEAAVALAIVLSIYRNRQTVNLDEVDQLKG